VLEPRYTSSVATLYSGAQSRECDCGMVKEIYNSSRQVDRGSVIFDLASGESKLKSGPSQVVLPTLAR